MHNGVSDRSYQWIRSNGDGRWMFQGLFSNSVTGAVALLKPVAHFVATLDLRSHSQTFRSTRQAPLMIMSAGTLG